MHFWMAHSRRLFRLHMRSGSLISWEARVDVEGIPAGGSDPILHEARIDKTGRVVWEQPRQ